eukprot:g6566.t1
MILMFTCSALFHYWAWDERNQRFLLMLDHIGINSMIAGCYTPLTPVHTATPHSTKIYRARADDSLWLLSDAGIRLDLCSHWLLRGNHPVFDLATNHARPAGNREHTACRPPRASRFLHRASFTQNWVGERVSCSARRVGEHQSLSLASLAKKNRRTKVTAGVPPTNTRGFTIGVPFHLCPSIEFHHAMWHLFVFIGSSFMYSVCLLEVAARPPLKDQSEDPSSEAVRFSHENRSHIAAEVISPDCSFSLQLELQKVDLELLSRKVLNYGVLMNTLTLLQLRSFLSQMRYHEDCLEEHATVTKLSALGIAMQALMDAYDSFLHLSVAAPVQVLNTYSFAVVSMLKFSLFALVEIRYLLLIWRHQNQHMFAEGWEAVRQELSRVYAQFYGALVSGLVLAWLPSSDSAGSK